MAGVNLSSLYLPAAVYEALPALYFLAGVATLLNLNNDLAHFSGAVLIVTAFHVSYMRVRARKFANRMPKGDPEMALIGMSWLHQYQLDVPQIDKQHEELFQLSHELLEALMASKRDEINSSIDELAKAIHAHFREEDKLLEEMGSPHARAHAKLHRRLESKMNALLKRFYAGKVERYAVAHFLMYDVVRQHMIEQDAHALGYSD